MDCDFPVQQVAQLINWQENIWHLDEIQNKVAKNTIEKIKKLPISCEGGVFKGGKSFCLSIGHKTSEAVVISTPESILVNQHRILHFLCKLKLSSINGIEQGMAKDQLLVLRKVFGELHLALMPR